MDSQGRPTAADIPDFDFLLVARDLSQQATVDIGEGAPYVWTGPLPRWVSIWEMQRRMPAHPPKVVAAKFRKLVKRGLVKGCPCGCRGDIELTELGLKTLRDGVSANLVANIPDVVRLP